MQFEELAKAGSAIYLDIYADAEKIGRVEIGRRSFRPGMGRTARRGVAFVGPHFSSLLDSIVMAKADVDNFSHLFEQWEQRLRADAR